MTTPTNQQPPVSPASPAEVETLKCPACGYTITREEHPGAAYCGPHPERTWDPGAKQMLRVPAPSLVRLAELDAAASEGPWEAHDGDDYSCVMRGDESTDEGIQNVSSADAHFIAAAKGFAPALVKRLEALAERMDRAAADHRYAQAMVPPHYLESYARELRALIRGEGEA